MNSANVHKMRGEKEAITSRNCSFSVFCSTTPDKSCGKWLLEQKKGWQIMDKKKGEGSKHDRGESGRGWVCVWGRVWQGAELIAVKSYFRRWDGRKVNVEVARVLKTVAKTRKREKKRRICQQSAMVCCVYVCMVGFLYISAHEPSESVRVQKIQICTLRTSVYFNHLCG